MDVEHFFVLNPAAGARSAQRRLESELKKLSPLPYTLYITSGMGDAAAFVRETCQSHTEPLRFYACGGDGTLGEVAGGAAGFPHAAVAAWPCGSGNDFIKCFGGEGRFLDLSRQINAGSVLVDIIKVGERASINVVNIGLEAHAAATVSRFRQKPVVGGKNAYLIGTANAVLRHMKTDCTITADNEVLHQGPLLTASFASGRYIGGGFLCAPKAVNDDGLMDVCVIRPFSRATLIKLIGIYKQGGHLDSPAFKPYLGYTRAKQVRIQTKEEAVLCLDGEIIHGKDFNLEIIPRAVRFILPDPLPRDSGEENPSN